MALQLSREMLANSLNNKKGNCNEEEGNDNDTELHESLAPLYYLYGTTLLYSVEESDVMMASSGSGGEAVGDIEVSPEDEQQVDGDDDYDHGE